jgi:NAD(P)-dependent dehydrogenase (short-subunit alcohol dehydrogenase family)
MAGDGNGDPEGVALVTGGGRGIGEEIATVLGDAGYAVAVAARTREEVEAVAGDIADAGGRARAYTADLAHPGEIDDLAAAVEADLGAVDVLVNNAGIGAGGQSPWEADPETWWHVLEVNLRGPMRLCRRLVPGMVARDRGYVINVGSLAGARPAPMSSAYGVSKAALARLGDSTAAALADRDSAVCVFTVSPGLVRTEMPADVPVSEDLPSDAWTPIEEVGDLVRRLVGGDFDALSGRFIHVGFDHEAMLENADRIVDEGLYVLRIPGLDGLVE